MLTKILSLLTHTQIMKKKTQNLLIIWIIWAMQWILMAAGIAAFVEYYTGSDWINLFCGFFFVFMSFKTHKMRVLFTKSIAGHAKNVEFLVWLSKQNRFVRRYHGRKIAKRMRKQSIKQQ